MAKDQIIAAIDVGSSKVVSLIAELEEGRVQIIGVSSVASRGIKKGVIVDIDEAVEVISESLEAAERMAGVSVSRAWVTVNGNHISSVNSQGVVAVASADGEIQPSDVERVTEAARAISMPSSREIIHVLPRTFIVDSQEGIDDPIGMSGVRLQVETHIVSGATTSLRNLVKCVQQVGLDVENLVFTGLASAESLLTDTEKELGVVLIDIGGGTTTIMVFVEGSPVYSSVLKLGGKNITSDIAIGLRVPLEEAERIKEFVSRPNKSTSAKALNHDSDEEIDLSELGLESIQRVERRFLLDGVIRPRVEEIAEEVVQEIKKSGYEGLTPAGIVVGGGTALTVGIEESLETILDMPVRIGDPTGVSGLIDELRGPAFAASIGGVIYASHTNATGSRLMSGFQLPKVNLKGGLEKIISWIKGFIP